MKKFLRMFIYLCLYAAVIGMFIYLGKKDYGDNIAKYTDAQKFNVEYPDIPVDNNFKYIYAYELTDLIKHGTGIVYIGFSSNDWSQYYVNYLYDALKEDNIDNIYYYDLLKDRSRQGKYYMEIVDLLSNYLYENDNKKVSLNTPMVLFIKDGVVVHYDDETSLTRYNVNPSDYWTEDRINCFEDKINTYVNGEDYNG